MKFSVLLVAVLFAAHSASAHANCSDSEYLIYQKYDQLLEENANVPAASLRIIYAKRIGMQPEALKLLYTRCSARWAQNNRDEARDYTRKMLEDAKRDCARRPKDDPVCRSLTR